MAGPSVVTLLALLAVLAAPGPAAGACGSPAPVLDSGLSEGVRKAVELSFPLAHQRVGEAVCGGLFARLGAEGKAIMAATSYHPATPEQQRRYCHGTTHALTHVGDSRVALCPSFRRLGTSDGALILIHEALHFAGQTESPSDPSAPDSAGITRMVMAGCGFL